MVKKLLIYINFINQNLFFLDLTMPIMDGFEALKHIKEFDKDVNAVVISADIQKQAIDKALELGAFKLYQKPIDSSKMQQIIENNLIKRKNESKITLTDDEKIAFKSL